MDLLSHTITFRHALAQWYATAQRPLPWRTQPSLYRTVVSELMAQQTQIKTMLPYFERWMRRFPDFAALAEAPAEDVLKHWEGLGYYSRARNLHKLAKEYVALEPKPRSREDWQQLPGIGPYTSAAISSIALGEPAAVVDGNVVRILARLTDDARVFKNNGEAVKAFTPTAEAVLDQGNAGEHNQAMMELGATVCLKHKPLCTVCPVLAYCAASRKGSQEALPKIERKATVKVEVERAWVLQAGKLLLHRIAEDSGQLAGQYELPRLETVASPRSAKQLLASKSRSITHRRIKEHIYQVKAKPRIDASLEWVRLEDIERITLSGPHRRWIGELLARESEGGGLR
ncbi:MAG: Fe-S cluster assembly protein HesB [Puniceicoccaceae bacterium]|nr:Fe-S cluster assembly protein HesB [Puniceicoccaceae bacterium]|tara:strand:- start:5840 stop:6871 length:1032 start_codon:yes stop_codon:yes gene_type:complete